MGALFLFLPGVSEFFGKIESKLLNSRELAGGFVMRCAKKVCSIIKSLRSQTKVWKLATLGFMYSKDYIPSC